MRASGYDRVAEDWYVEDEQCVIDLLAVEKLSGINWDPSCGGGNIPRVLRAAGYHCTGSDIVNRGFGSQQDFMAPTTSGRVDNIICNPPYGIIEPWIDKALILAQSRVIVLARLAFLEGQRRKAKFAQWPLARVWVSSRRISMPPGGTDIKASGGTIAYAWFVFDHTHCGPATVGWL